MNNIYIYIYVYLFIYLFQARFFHNDIFRYVTREISQDISWCYLVAVLSKLITRVVIATRPGSYKFSGFLQLPLL